jgi:hypothetical protein
MDGIVKYQNEYDGWAADVREVKDKMPADLTVQYDFFVRTLLNYMQTRKFKEPKVFAERSGKEYPAMLVYLQETVHVDDAFLETYLTPEFFEKTLNLANHYKRLR